MKKTLLILLALCIAAPTMGQDFVYFKKKAAAAAPAADECDGMLICQNFEGTGYDNEESWGENVSTGSIDEDSTTSPLRGSQTLSMGDGSLTQTAIAITDISEIWGHTLLRMADFSPSSEQYLVEFFGADGATSLGNIRYRTTGVIRGYHGTTVANGTATPSDGATQHVWFHFKSSTGANDGVLQIWVGTTTSRGDASLEVNISTGTATAAVDQIKLSARPDASNTIDYDQVLVDNSEFTTVSN